MRGNSERGLNADMFDPQGVKKLRQGRLFSSFDRFDDVRGRGFGKTFERQKIADRQFVKIGRITDQAFVHERFNRLFAQAFDVHGRARDKMPDRRRIPGKTIFVGAYKRNDARRAREFRAAHRALLWRMDRFFPARPEAGQNLHDLGNDVAGFFQNDRVPYFNAEPFDLV